MDLGARLDTLLRSPSALQKASRVPTPSRVLKLRSVDSKCVPAATPMNPPGNTEGLDRSLPFSFVPHIPTQSQKNQEHFLVQKSESFFESRNRKASQTNRTLLEIACHPLATYWSCLPMGLEDSWCSCVLSMSSSLIGMRWYWEVSAFCPHAVLREHKSTSSKQNEQRAPPRHRWPSSLLFRIE